MKQNEQTAREYTGIDNLTGGPDGKTYIERVWRRNEITEFSPA
ncbi:MAG TPA: hypothetical protein VHP54_04220 [Caproiciproducens sp.]|nr:hypothetical protein [Caproiciproducens sp.]